MVNFTTESSNVYLQYLSIASYCSSGELDGQCLKLLFSKAVGYVILLLTSIFIKMPQLVKIIRARSSHGVNYVSELLLLTVSSTSVCYNIVRGYPIRYILWNVTATFNGVDFRYDVVTSFYDVIKLKISTWGESIAMSVQSLAIGALILHYSGHSTAAVVHTVTAVLCFILLLSSLVPMSVHIFFQLLAVPFVSSSKLLQIWTNWRHSGTGQLSGLTLVTQALRSAGRLVTSLIETGDVYRIGLYSSATLLNCVLLLQIVRYRHATERSGQTSKHL